MSTEDNLWSDDPSTMIDNASIAIVAAALNEDQCIKVRDLEAETEIPQTTVHCILTKHLLKKTVAVW